MKHDDRRQQAALVMSVVLVLIGCGWMGLLHLVRPAGLAGQALIVGNRDTGAVYARIAGRFHPALNLTSARLVTGSATEPTWVHGSEIDKHPTGPMVGIPGIPDDLSVSGNPMSAWTICDSAPTNDGRDDVTVTAIAGELPSVGRAAALPASHAVLGIHESGTYLIWNGHRTGLNLADRSVLLTLGLDAATTQPVPVSNALFDAIPATEPLVVPRIPDTGTPSRWLPGTAVGRLLVTDDATGKASGFYILLSDGVQRITPFVVDLLRAGGSAAPQLVTPSTIAGIPDVTTLAVDFYPTGRLTFVDAAANPVTCVAWTKHSTDPQSTSTLLTGRGLPIPPDRDASIVQLVRDSRETGSFEAQQIAILPDAATFAVSTSAAPSADSRETLYWVSPQGVRYGIDNDPATWRALGIDPRRAVQAPWALLRTFAAGPVISRAAALVARDRVDPAGAATPIPGAGERDGSR